MRFRIHCKNPSTGQSHEFDLDARDRREAERQVVDAGLVVGLIEIATEKAAGDTPPSKVANSHRILNVRTASPAVVLLKLEFAEIKFCTRPSLTECASGYDLYRSG